MSEVDNRPARSPSCRHGGGLCPSDLFDIESEAIGSTLCIALHPLAIVFVLVNVGRQLIDLLVHSIVSTVSLVVLFRADTTTRYNPPPRLSSWSFRWPGVVGPVRLASMGTVEKLRQGHRGSYRFGDDWDGDVVALWLDRRVVMEWWRVG